MSNEPRYFSHYDGEAHGWRIYDTSLERDVMLSCTDQPASWKYGEHADAEVKRLNELSKSEDERRLQTFQIRRSFSGRYAVMLSPNQLRVLRRAMSAYGRALLNRNASESDTEYTATAEILELMQNPLASAEEDETQFYAFAMEVKDAQGRIGSDSHPIGTPSVGEQ